MGGVQQVQARFPGLVWQWNEDEDAALEYLPWVDQVLYLRGLRRHMDFATGIVGQRRRISYQQFRELLEVQRERGSTAPSERPNLAAVRASLARLERAGLVERIEPGAVADRSGVVLDMFFKLPLAHVGLVRSFEEQQMNSTGAATRENSALVRVGAGMNNTVTEGMNNTHLYNSNNNNSTDVECQNSGEFSDAVVAIGPGIGDCPHRELLALWSAVFPGLAQPNPSLWARSQSATALRARWREAAAIRHSVTGLPLYADTAGGLAWWRMFFEYLRDRCGGFLLRSDSRFFDLHWLVKKQNFFKALDKKYEDRT